MSFAIPRQITLLPKTKRLKELIKLHGDRWVLLRSDYIAAFNGELGYFIQTLDATHSRWVKPEQILG